MIEKEAEATKAVGRVTAGGYINCVVFTLPSAQHLPVPWSGGPPAGLCSGVV